MEKLLEIKNLRVQYNTDEAVVYALNNFSLELNKGEILGVVGETGAGKTTMALSIITHDLGIVAEFCENVAVVYGGEVIERGSVEQIFTRKANHPYTDSLFNCIPDLTSDVERLTPIPGFVLDMRTVPTGCPFAERCTKCTPRCKQEKPAIHTVEDGHYIKCHLFENEVSK